MDFPLALTEAELKKLGFMMPVSTVWEMKAGGLQDQEEERYVT